MALDGGVTITASLTSRRDLERFLAISDKLLALFPPDPAPEPPPIDNEHVAEGCEQFTVSSTEGRS